MNMFWFALPIGLGFMQFNCRLLFRRNSRILDSRLGRWLWHANGRLSVSMEMWGTWQLDYAGMIMCAILAVCAVAITELLR
jgi:hypothetical protein